MPVDYDEVRSKEGEDYFEKLYFTTDFVGLYYIDEESLSFINANPLEILRVPNKLMSVEDIIAKSADITGDLYAKVIFRDLVVETRKHADVYFADFDSQFTSKLRYENPKAKGETVIYRGENAQSQSYLFTYSWTTSREKAEWFANCFEQGRVLQAKVPNNRIIYTYKDDDEHEVLVHSDDLLEVITL